MPVVALTHLLCCHSLHYVKQLSIFPKLAPGGNHKYTLVILQRHFITDIHMHKLGFEIRIGLRYPRVRRKRWLKLGGFSENGWPRVGSWMGTLKPYKMSMAWQPDLWSIFFSPPTHQKLKYRWLWHDWVRVSEIGCLTSHAMIFQSYMWRHIDVQADRRISCRFWR